MNDLLVGVGRRPVAHRVVRALRLPLWLPPVLERASGPWRRRELEGRLVGVVDFADDALATAFADMLAGAGARVRVIGGRSDAFARAGEAFGVPLARQPDVPLDRLLVDATGVTSPDRLLALHGELHQLVPRLAQVGRVVVLAPAPLAAGAPSAAAAAAALEGFVRSLAKELGRRGTTAHLLSIEPGAEARASAIARFLLSARSAFITGQPLRASMTAVDSRELTYVQALDRKVALVTGAARGIGASIARRLAEEGAHVVCVDLPGDETALAAVATAIGGSLLVADVADGGTADRIGEHLRARHGGVDIVVHNAGLTRDRTFARMTPTEWSRVLEVNLLAVVRMTGGLAPELLREGGRVMCLSSVAGIAGNVGQTNYAAAKAGLIGYVRALARDLAPRGITVNAVAPGFIETRMTSAMPVVIREAGRRLSALGQGGQPGDVAEAVAFLAQPAAIGITGAALRVCGGALIGA